MANVVDPQQNDVQPTPQKSGSGKGCLWGCLIVTVLFVGSILCAGFGAYTWLGNQVEKYTSDAPIDLPSVEYTEEEAAALKSKVDEFKEKLDEGEVPEEDLILSADDINALISQEEKLKGRAFVEIEDDKVKGQISVPLDDIPMGKGRFLNASGTFEVTMDDGILIVTADELTVKGEPLPDEFMEAIRKENLAKDAYKDADNAKFLRQFKEISVKDGNFILRLKREGDEDSVQDNPLLEDESEEVETAEETESEVETSEETVEEVSEETSVEEATE